MVDKGGYALALTIHYLLPDFEHPDWLIWRWIGMGVAVTLLLRPFVLALVGSIVIQFVTLLLLRDVLTQTVLLLIFGTLGLSLRLRWSLKRLGGIADITATTYLVAAIHKLNEGFVDASTSYANHAWRQIDNRWSNLLPDVGDAFLPPLVLLVELCLAMLFFSQAPLLDFGGRIFICH